MVATLGQAHVDIVTNSSCKIGGDVHPYSPKIEEFVGGVMIDRVLDFPVITPFAEAYFSHSPWPWNPGRGGNSDRPTTKSRFRSVSKDR